MDLERLSEPYTLQLNPCNCIHNLCYKTRNPQPVNSFNKRIILWRWQRNFAPQGRKITVDKVNRLIKVEEATN